MFLIKTGIFICTLYLVVLLCRRKYRLVLPSTIHTFTWLALFVVMYIERKMGGFQKSTYSTVLPFEIALVISSIIGFSISHILVPNRLGNCSRATIPIEVLEVFLKKFRWVLWACLIVSLCQTFYIVSVGGIGSLSDYRDIAVTVEHSGFSSYVFRISGHLFILGTFYIGILGYKQGMKAFELKEFLKVFFIVGFLNISIGGRLWLLSFIPFVSTYFLALRAGGKSIDKSVIRKFSLLIILIILFFAFYGIARGQHDTSKADFIQKFSYYTDGSMVSDMVLSRNPPDSYELEMGGAEFLIQFKNSTMTDKYERYVENDPYLYCIVTSSIPSLYYDFGYWGGIVMWGIFCCLFEMICTGLIYTKSILGLMVFNSFAVKLFEAPIFSIFPPLVIVLEWCAVILLLRIIIIRIVPQLRAYF